MIPNTFKRMIRLDGLKITDLQQVVFMSRLRIKSTVLVTSLEINLPVPIRSDLFP